MKWKKILSLMIVSVLVVSVLVTFASTARGEDYEPVEEVNFGVTFSMSDGAAAAAQGDVHMFMHSIDGDVYQGLPPEFLAALDAWEVFGTYNNYLLNPAHEGYNTVPMDDAVGEQFNDAEDVKYLANNFDEVWTVNPFAHNAFRFAFQYLDREEMAEDLLEGFATPRYGPMDARLEAWQEYFVEPIEDDYGLSPEGDIGTAEWLAEYAMNDIAEYIDETHPDGGELYQEDGDWMYEGFGQEAHQIEIRIYSRLEDWRDAWGDWTGAILEDWGFDVHVEKVDLADALPTTMDAVPDFDQMEYHIYTGGWIATAAVFYQEAGVNQMYMPWYGFMHTYGAPDHYQYDDEGYDDLIGPDDYVRQELGLPDRPYGPDATVEDADIAGGELFAGQFPDEDAYWEDKVELVRAGFEESIRVFTVTTQSFYPVNREKMGVSVPESVNGYDTFFGPRTMTTDDGRLDTLIMTGEAQPYMDNWNVHGGSDDVYGEYQRRLALEYGSWMHPQTGLPMQVGNYWESGVDELSDPARNDPYERHGNVEDDYDWELEDGEWVLDERIPIPETAVDYFPEYGEWQTVDEYLDEEDQYAAVAVTIDTHDDYVYHDGSDFSIHDLMFQYARVRELGTDCGEDRPYRGATETANLPWWGSIHAIEWDAEHGTYTMYGDNTFPMDAKLGQHYSFFVETNPITYLGFDWLHNTEEYGYDAADPGDWIHQLIETHSRDMIAELRERYVDEDKLPRFVDGDNMPADLAEDFAWSQADFNDRVDLIEAFVDDTGHSFIGLGPFRIDDYDEENHDMDITWWDDYGYPLPGQEGPDGNVWERGYWAEQFLIEAPSLDFMDAPASVYEGAEFTVTVSAHWAQIFPELLEEDLEGRLDHYEFRITELLRGDPILVEDDIEEDHFADFSSFEATLDTTGIDTGSYFVEFHAWEDIEESPEVIFADIDIVEMPDEAELTVEVEGDGSVELNGETVESGETETFTFDFGDDVTLEAIEDEDFIEWSGDIGDEDPEALEITLTMDQDRSVTAEFEEEEDPGIPGFTAILLAVAAIAAVAIYYKKEN